MHQQSVRDGVLGRNQQQFLSWGAGGRRWSVCWDRNARCACLLSVSWASARGRCFPAHSPEQRFSSW